MRLVSLICLLQILMGCGLERSKHFSKWTYNNYLAEAFDKKDTVYVISVMGNMSDRNLTDVEFYDMLVRFCQVSGFYYGNLDARSYDYKKKSRHDKDIRRENTLAILSLYAKSCFFMKHVDPDILGSIQEDFWRDKERLSSKELIKVKHRFEILCTQKEINN